MTKHIHIHLPPGVTVSQVRTGDSDWDESKHKRDDGGKFSSGGGGGKSAPIKHASATGQTFLPKQSSVAAGSVVKTGSGFTAKNPQGFKEFFKPHEEAQAKAWAAGAPRKESGTERSYMGKGNHQPGWMLRADPVLAAKVKQAQERRAERSAIAKHGPSAPAGGPNWSGSNGNWDKAKKEGRELVQAKLQEAKTGGDRTDALLALKKQAEVEHKKGSYLAAVVIGEVNDYFARVK